MTSSGYLRAVKSWGSACVDYPTIYPFCVSSGPEAKCVADGEVEKLLHLRARAVFSLEALDA